MSSLRALDNQPLLIVAALGLGLLIAAAPLPVAVAVIVGGILAVGTLVAPLIGLLITIGVGLAEPLLFAAFPGAPPIGHICFAFFAGVWLLRGAARRQIVWPPLPITIPFALYLFAAALPAVLTHPPSPRDSLTELIKWIEMYLIAGILVDLAGRKKLGWVLAILFCVGVIQAGIGLWQFQFRGHGPEGFRILGDHYRAYGTLEQPNPFGGFMGVVWPVAAAIATAIILKGISRIRTRTHTEATFPRPHPPSLILFVSAFLVAALTLGALFLSFSRGAWLGAAAAASVMLIFWPRRRWIGAGLTVGGLAGVLILHNFGLLPGTVAGRFADVGDFLQVYDVRGVHINDTNFAIVERLAHWQAAMNMAEANPLFGVGFGNYDAAYEKYRLINWRYGLGHAHMIYLNVLAETGAVGLAAYLTLWAAIVGLTLRVINRASGMERAIGIGLMGVWTHLATHQLLDNLYVGNIPLYLGALFGVLCILSENVKRKM